MTMLDDRPTQRNGAAVITDDSDHDLPQPQEPPASAPPIGWGAVHAPPPALGDDLSKALRVIRVLALTITGLVGAAAAALSFASLADLAARAGYPAELSYLWPGIVDGTILLASMAIVVVGPHGGLQRANRRFFWLVLATAAVVSVGGNVVHALLPHGASLPYWLAVPIAMVAPLSLLGNVHTATILGRLRAPTAALHSAAQARDASPVHDAIAMLAKERNTTVKAISERSVREIADILRADAAGVSQRALSRETGLHHRVIRAVVEAGAQVRDRMDIGDDVAAGRE